MGILYFFEQIKEEGRNGKLDVGFVYNTLFAGRGVPHSRCSAHVLGSRAREWEMVPRTIVTARRARERY